MPTVKSYRRDQKIHQKFAGRPLEELERVANAGVLATYKDEALLGIGELTYTQKVLMGMGMLKAPLKVTDFIDARFASVQGKGPDIH